MKDFKQLSISVIFLIFGCQKNSNDPAWNKVVKHFTNPAVTKEEIFNQISPNAISAIIGAYPVNDSTQKLVNFFKEYENNHNYSIEKYSDTVYLTFNPQQKIAGGPLIYIHIKDSTWKVIEIVFGK